MMIGEEGDKRNESGEVESEESKRRALGSVMLGDPDLSEFVSKL